MEHRKYLTKTASSSEPSTGSRMEVSNTQSMSADSGWIFALEVTLEC